MDWDRGITYLNLSIGICSIEKIAEDIGMSQGLGVVVTYFDSMEASLWPNCSGFKVVGGW